MRKFERAQEPDFLTDKWRAWGQEWEQRKAGQSGASFNWRVVGGIPVNQLLLVSLMQQTQEHCSFYDAHPVCPPSDPTIEHFRPKAEYPLEAYHWPNLYFCCRYCQKKEGSFSEDVLRPDDSTYNFDSYFRWDHTTGILEVNPAAEPKNRERARNTIEYFRLNEGHPTIRLRQQHLRALDRSSPLDPFPYRDFLSA